MRVFPLLDIDELFYDKFPNGDSWPAGAFHYQLQFFDLLNTEEENSLTEWLSYNCKQNFVFIKNSSAILAGGCVNNKEAWEKQVHNLEPVITEYTIRLCQSDIWLFRMVWVTD